MREIILDIESTGLNTQDRIVEIACVELFDKQPTGEHLQIYIDPQQQIPEEVVKIHGITNEMLIGQPIFRECWQQVKSFIGTSPIVAHNASFDVNMINHELNLILQEPLTNIVIDTLNLAKKKFQSSNSLDALAKRYKIKAERKLHGALKDCYILASVYYYLSITEMRMDNSDLITVEESFTFPYRNNPSQVSEEEMRVHKEFILKYKVD